MGHHPSSRFGFGVMIDSAAVRYDGEPPEDSPSFLLQSGEPDSTGISLHDTGDYRGFFFLLIHESVSVSPDWMGAVIPPAAMTEKPSWAPAVEAYLDRWDLRKHLCKGFEKPAFLHFPYYG